MKRIFLKRPACEFCGSALNEYRLIQSMKNKQPGPEDFDYQTYTGTATAYCTNRRCDRMNAVRLLFITGRALPRGSDWYGVQLGSDESETQAFERLKALYKRTSHSA